MGDKYVGDIEQGAAAHSGRALPSGSPSASDYYVAKDAYVSPEIARFELERLWPKVWQVACREEEIPKRGDFVTYELGSESVIVVRSADDQIRAFNNACMHRGRRLTSGCGRANKLFCKFHGWRWDLQGKIESIPDREHWCDQLTDEEVALPEFKVDTWGGFVFISFDPNAEPLLDYLDPIPKFLACYELDRMRYKSYVTFPVEANWKTAQEAFTEAYHIQTTHRQASPYMDSRATTHAHNKHMQMCDAMPAQVGFHVNDPETDPRLALLNVYREFSNNIPFSNRAYGVATRLLDLPPETSFMEAAMALYQWQKEAAVAAGVGWPEAPIEQFAQAGIDWNFFPNLTCVLSPDAAVFYRIRPMGDNPDRCLFDLWRLERYAPGAEPQLVRERYDSWEEYPDMPLVLRQDFQNIADVQAGMKTTAWKGARVNPKQELSISHFNRTLMGYLGLSSPEPDKNAADGQSQAAGPRKATNG
ncbi:MAG: aromatic ring-hydroxylating dioxygenase subunit alpha [Gammaproteobacteria bacterium]|nr:aromatic ring-hydroxylating dioxygenase subunit alpha [Gammaproteobacteria bacterium]